MKSATDIQGPKRMHPADFNKTLTSRSTLHYFKQHVNKHCMGKTGQDNLIDIGFIALEFGFDIHGPLRMNPNNFGNPVTFMLQCVTMTLTDSLLAPS